MLTGGVAQLAGLAELSRDQLTWPVRVGRPNGLGASVADLSSPEYATAVGLLLWGRGAAHSRVWRYRRVALGGDLW